MPLRAVSAQPISGCRNGSGQIFAAQHEDELVAAFGLEPGKGEGWVSRFEYIAVVTNLHYQQAAGVEMGFGFGQRFGIHIGRIADNHVIGTAFQGHKQIRRDAIVPILQLLIVNIARSHIQCILGQIGCIDPGIG